MSTPCGLLRRDDGGVSLLLTLALDRHLRGKQTIFFYHLQTHGRGLGRGLAHTDRNLCGGLGAIDNKEIEDGRLDGLVLDSLSLFGSLGIIIA